MEESVFNPDGTLTLTVEVDLRTAWLLLQGLERQKRCLGQGNADHEMCNRLSTALRLRLQQAENELRIASGPVAGPKSTGSGF